MLKTSNTNTTISADDLTVWRIASRVAEVYGRIESARRDRNVPVSADDIAGVLDASLLGHEDLRDRVIALLKAGR